MWYLRNCGYTNVKAPFLLLVLITRREGNLAPVERSSGSKITRCLFSMSFCLFDVSFCRLVMSSCLLDLSSRSGKAESWQLSLTSGLRHALYKLRSRSDKKILNTKVVDGGNRLVVIWYSTHNRTECTSYTQFPRIVRFSTIVSKTDKVWLNQRILLNFSHVWYWLKAPKRYTCCRTLPRC